MARSKVIASAGVLCYCNGVKVGVITSFRWDSQTPHTEIRAIDSLEPFELMPTGTSIRGTMGLVRTLYDGGAEGLGMTSQFGDIPREKYFSLMLVEYTSDTILFQADYCSVVSQSWDVEAKSIVKGSVQFTALDWRNEFTKSDKA